MTTDHPQKITFGEMRASGVRDVLVYCRDHHCSHHIRISADFWPDHLRLSDIEDRFVCRVCGKRGADIRRTFVLVYCRDHHCSHCVRISADFWPDHLRLSDIEEQVRVPGLRQARRSRTRLKRMRPSPNDPAGR